ncbi:MAG: YjgP/YjgQ family permease [Chlorobiaceae bacterium]|nr:YjgP/YjgQ family permease [Chlorobiaceae bacterium]NTW73474.1 YjgP/YjgQ family permease [Chlorobiaceae bacterium]
MKILDRYILKAHAGPLFFGFFTIMFVFILSFLTRFMDRLVGKGLDIGVLVEMVLLQSAWMVSLALPMSVLVATVMAFGALTNSSEMTVMRSGGISIYRLVAPVMLGSVLLAGFNERFNNVLLPEANYQANALLSDITRLKPGFAVDQGAFSDIVQGYSLMARKVNNETGELYGVVMYDRERPGVRTVITARKGKIAFTPDYRYLVMTLYDGQTHELDLPGMNKYRRVTFLKHRYVFEAAGYGFERSDENKGKRGGRELSADRLRAVAEEYRKKVSFSERLVGSGPGELSAQVAMIRKVNGPARPAQPKVWPDPEVVKSVELMDGRIVSLTAGIEQLESNRSQYNMYMVEYHKKYSLAFACVVFALVGAPLGVLARRGGFGVGAGLSLLFFVLYWAMMIGGEKLAERGFLTPGISVWLPNMLLATAGILMLYRLNRSISGSGR